MSARPPPLIAHGESDAGLVRRKNEDSLLIDADLGLYLVLDGMGGHSGGEVASAMARDAVRAYVALHRGRRAPRDLLEGAIGAASEAIHARARVSRELHGMGTTIVACLVVDDRRVLLAHVGDSRAYLLREGKLALLTADHTIVAELVARGALSAAEAERHPYKSVLSRNVGGRPEAEVEISELGLEAGDRLVLCSDGLSGFASHQAMEQVVAGATDPARAVRDLIELALRGGGGDNVTALVLETERSAPFEPTAILRRDAAAAWTGRRARFLEAARALDVARSPLCAVLSADEAIEIVAGNLFEALASDLEQTTGIYVWTYAQNLASGWLDQGGVFAEVRALIATLAQAVEAVVADVAASDASLALVLEATVVRALVVAETALAAVLGERLRRLEDELATRQGDETLLATIADRPGPATPIVEDEAPATPAVLACLAGALSAADHRLRRQAVRPEAVACLAAAHELALGGQGRAASLAIVRTLIGGRPLSESGILPLTDALDRARRAHLSAAAAEPAAAEVRAAALQRLGLAHQRLGFGLAELVCEAAGEVRVALRQLSERTAALRAELGDGEVLLSRLEQRHAASEAETGASS